MPDNLAESIVLSNFMWIIGRVESRFINDDNSIFFLIK